MTPVLSTSLLDYKQMKIFKAAKKVGKFTFITIPLSLFSFHQLKIGNSVIKSLWQSINSPVCPHCDKGILEESDSIDIEKLFIDTNDKIQHHNPHLKKYYCTKCDFSLINSNNELTLQIMSYRKIRFQKEITESGRGKERNTLIQQHTHSSRILFFVSLSCFFGFLYLIVSGSSIIIAANWFCIAATLSILAMKKSYRAWQVETGNIFIKGAFIHWLTYGRWFI